MEQASDGRVAAAPRQTVLALIPRAVALNLAIGAIVALTLSGSVLAASPG